MRDRCLAAGFADVAAAYERGRPEYPPESVDRLVRELHLDRSSVVLDLAAGTGKLTRALSRRFDHVVAVEPLGALRAELANRARDAALLEGTAEQIPLHAESVRAVFVAQAFHWFDGEPALDELARVLEPTGGLALLWNTAPWERREDTWFTRLDDLLEESRSELPLARRQASGNWRKAFENEPRLSPLSSATFRNPRRVSVDIFLADLASRSYVARLLPSAKRGLISKVERLLERGDAPVVGDKVVVPVQTEVHWARRLA